MGVEQIDGSTIQLTMMVYGSIVGLSIWLDRNHAPKSPYKNYAM